MESLDQKQQQQLNYLLPNLQKWGILLLDTLFFMPKGAGTYGSKVGRPKAKKTTKKTTKKKLKKM